jgi:hypothetical protein
MLIGLASRLAALQARKRVKKLLNYVLKRAQVRPRLQKIKGLAWI